MEYESEQFKPNLLNGKCFKSLSQRHAYFELVLRAFEDCQNHAELICTYQNFEHQLDELAKGNEYDLIYLEHIQSKYKALHVRHDEDREYIRKVVEAWQEKQLSE